MLENYERGTKWRGLTAYLLVCLEENFNKCKKKLT
jgi:hypothetical protein